MDQQKHRGINERFYQRLLDRRPIRDLFFILSARLQHLLKLRPVSSSSRFPGILKRSEHAEVVAVTILSELPLLALAAVVSVCLVSRADAQVLSKCRSFWTQTWTQLGAGQWFPHA